MKRRTLIILLLLTIDIVSMTVPSCIFGPDNKKPKKEEVPKPGEPPDNPPPPPPPPPGALRYSGAQSLEAIAGDVLEGRYGPQLQLLLADEVSACVNMMASAGMVSAHVYSDETRLKRHESETDRILYSDAYLVEWILTGRYGQTARLNLHDFIRSFETENRIP